MKVRVLREACCAADDQLGPLDAQFDLSEHSTFGELVAQISAARFLQFSSTHNRISGEIDDVCVVEMFPTEGSPPLFHVDPSASIGSVVGNRTLFFRFRHV